MTPRSIRRFGVAMAMATTLAAATTIGSTMQAPAVGALRGMVSERNGGGPLPGVMVSLQDAQGAWVQQTTNAAGLYRFDALPPGPRRLHAAKTMFEPAEIAHVSVDAGRVTTIDLTLKFRTRAVEPLVELRALVEARIGAAPRHCGQFLLKPRGPIAPEPPALLDAALECALDAARAHQPFWTFVQLQGIDSWIARGLLGDTSGDISTFAYDSAPCGGLDCEGRLTVTRCTRPVAVTNDSEVGRATFTCR